MADFLNADYFRQGLMFTLGIINDLIDGGQPSAKMVLKCDLAWLYIDGV